ncbi:response regulator [Adhaeribacter aquaticus]|uniref:response regulator n=1 Tax=Adhaeribacter aquaticus TaxID=299567 RepID=UPI0003F6291B|nr:response regulator [Adhaeribacter aquaticus]
MPQTPSFLIIDDDKVSTFLVKKILSNEVPECNVISLEGSIEALHWFKEVTLSGDILPETVLLDINMPDLDGFELIEELEKAKIDLSKVKLFFYSSSEDPTDIQKAFSLPLPIAGYISKPLNRKKIEAIFSKSPE